MDGSPKIYPSGGEVGLVVDAKLVAHLYQAGKAVGPCERALQNIPIGVDEFCSFVDLANRYADDLPFLMARLVW